MIISEPLKGVFGVSASETLTARGVGMPSSACQVSKSECQENPAPPKPGL